MASSVKQTHYFFFLAVIILSSSLHISLARDFQSFSKIPAGATSKNGVVPEKEADDQPNFLPQNEESYGLYGHDAGQLPPSATTAEGESKPKYLPKNYNTVAYVTVPEDANEDKTTSAGDEFAEETSFSKNPNSKTDNYGNEENINSYYKEGQRKNEDFSEYRNNNYYYNNRLGSNFNSPRETTRFAGAVAGGEGLKPQGMSDTRFLENGKYHYDVNAGRFSSNHPYETLKGSVFRADANGLGRTNNEDVFNAEDNYVEDDGRFQDEDSNLP